MLKFLRKYGEATTITFGLREPDGVLLKSDAVCVDGDVVIMKDEGAEANVDADFVDEGKGYSLAFTAAEMTAARIQGYIEDQGIPVWLGREFVIETYGHENAQFPFFGEGVWDRVLTGATHNIPGSSGRRLRAVGDVVSGAIDDASATTTSFITDLTGIQLDHYADQTLLFTTGNLAGMSRSVLAYNESTKLVTIEEALPEAPANGDDFDINPVHIHPVSQIVFEIWEELLTSATHNIKNSAGRRMRELLEIAGYEGGFIYYDSTGGGSAGSTPFENGTLDDPVNNMADLNLLLAVLPFCCINITSGSSITFAASQEHQSFIGENWTLELNNQSISGSFIHGADVSGIATGAIKPKFEDCDINGVTLPPSIFKECGYSGNFVAGAPGDYFFTNDSHSRIAGITAPTFSYNAAIGAVNFNFRGYHGGQEIKEMRTGDNLSFDGDGQIIINADSLGGIMRIAGHQSITDAAAFIAAGGFIYDDARFAMDQIVDGVIGSGGDTLESLSDQIDSISAGILVVGGGGTISPTYAEENEPVEIIQGDVIDLPRYLEGDYSTKRLFFGAKTATGDTTYSIGIIECTNISYSGVTDKTSYTIPFVANNTKTVTPDTYKGEVEVRDADGTSNPVTGDRFDLNVIGEIIT